MNNKDKFIEWYVAQINPRTGKLRSENSAKTYLTYINRLVLNGLVPPSIFDCDARNFVRLVHDAEKKNLVRFADLNNHENLKDGIKWYGRFLNEMSK